MNRHESRVGWLSDQLASPVPVGKQFNEAAAPLVATPARPAMNGSSRCRETTPFGRCPRSPNGPEFPCPGGCFQVLRRSCETEWASAFPAHVVAGRLGHSEAVSRRPYLMVTDADFDRAAKPPVNPEPASIAKNAASEPENDAKSAAAESCNGAQASEVPQSATEENSDDSCENRVLVPFSGTAPGGTRTPDRRIRNPMLYPAELPARRRHAV